MTGTCAILLILLNTVFRNTLIVRYGIRIFDVMCRCSTISVGCLVVYTVILGLILLRHVLSRRRQSSQTLDEQQQREQLFTKYAEDHKDPELTLQVYIYLLRDYPAFDFIIKQCHEQMARMNEVQARQQKLIRSGAALYLKETIEVLDRVERQLCHNFFCIRNLIIAAGHPERIDRAKVNEFLSHNLSMLDDSEQLLSESANRINHYGSSATEADNEIKKWINRLRNATKEEQAL